jgi:hypothetical protein
MRMRRRRRMRMGRRMIREREIGSLGRKRSTRTCKRKRGGEEGGDGGKEREIKERRRETRIVANV